MKNLISIFLFLSLFLVKIEAQRTITGVVYLENDGEAITATVVVDGDEVIGIVTEFDGTFSLEIPETAKALEISYTGYISQVVPIEAINSINVTLKEGPQLPKVVILPYYKPKEIQAEIPIINPKN